MTPTPNQDQFRNATKKADSKPQPASRSKSQQESWEKIKEIVRDLYESGYCEAGHNCAVAHPKIVMEATNEIWSILQKERQRTREEVEKLDEISTVNTPAPYDIGDYHLVLKDQVLKLLEDKKT